MDMLAIRDRRFARLQELIAQNDLKGLYLVDYMVNYVKGWLGYAVFVPAGGDPVVMCGDHDRELPRIEWKADAAKGKKWITDTALFTLDELQRLCACCGADKGRLGLPIQFLTVPRYEAIRKALPDAEFVDISRQFITLSEDNDELNLFYAQESARVVKDSFEFFCRECRPGLTAPQLQTMLDCHMLTMGATGHFNLVKPVYRKSENKNEDPDVILPGDGWYAEVSCAWQTVWTQCIFTVSIGEENQLLQRLMDSNVAAYRRALGLIRGGVSSNVLNAPMDETINAFGFKGPGQHICLPLGHYQGMRMDGGCFAPGADLPLRENLIMVIHTASQDPQTGVSLFGPGCGVVVTKDGVSELYDIQTKLRVLR